MKYHRIMIAAPKSGSGKTTVTCALLQLLAGTGERVVSYKCGPDYIDPLFHEQAIGVPSRNLDTFFTGEETTRQLFLDSAPSDGIAVIEGVMGLYDGLGGIREEGSSYHLASVTKTPILLVMDVKGMGRSVISMLAGLLAYDRERLIRGVLLNRISAGYYALIQPLIEEELGLMVVGFLPEEETYRVESRHLGLVKPDALHPVREKLQALAAGLQRTVSLDRIRTIWESAEEMADISADCGRAVGAVTPKNAPVIAVARDEAFCFYYADNLRLLEAYGAQLRYFSPLHDGKLPEECHGLLIGGGYPELYAGALQENHAMRLCVKQAVEGGMPTVAECGGFLYLHTALQTGEGTRYDMAGVLPGVCFDTGRSVRFGYVELQEKQPNFLPEGERIKGHEFHYYDSTDSGSDVTAHKPVTGRTYSCMMEGENHWLGFAHLYYPSNPAFAASFVEKAGRYRQQAAQRCDR